MGKVRKYREKMCMLGSLKMGRDKVSGRSIIARVWSTRVNSEMVKNKEKGRNIFSMETSMKETT